MLIFVVIKLLNRRASSKYASAVFQLTDRPPDLGNTGVSKEKQKYISAPEAAVHSFATFFHVCTSRSPPNNRNLKLGFSSTSVNVGSKTILNVLTIVVMMMAIASGEL